ncbi:hypothetical protein TREES_T100011929 [Tupaia chinensis]|uniref:Uncharacterized protein n=1 Tax=Tupaia chinensis TaxID=246437 RepID=L9KU23_TUPCH|nr:hypothetical protein TREES_T100011929 [Tupaia chinensis]
MAPTSILERKRDNVIHKNSRMDDPSYTPVSVPDLPHSKIVHLCMFQSLTIRATRCGHVMIIVKSEQKCAPAPRPPLLPPHQPAWLLFLPVNLVAIINQFSYMFTNYLNSPDPLIFPAQALRCPDLN